MRGAARKLPVAPVIAPVLALLCAGCSSSAGPEAVEAGRPLTVGPASIADTETYKNHWTVGTRSAWFNAERHDVLVIDEATGRGIRISDLPHGYGSITATGWEKDRDFFVHFQEGSDGGTMAYIDLETGRITRIERWAAW